MQNQLKKRQARPELRPQARRIGQPSPLAQALKSLRPSPKMLLVGTGCAALILTVSYWPERESKPTLVMPEEMLTQIEQDADSIARRVEQAKVREIIEDRNEILDAEPVVELTQVNEEDLLPLLERPPRLEYSVAKGDTLSGIFNRFSISQRQMYEVLEADYALLALDTLRPGDGLRFWVDEADNSLERMEVVFDLAHKVVFTRHEDTYEVNEVLIDGDWVASSSEIDIQGSFSLSAQRAGLKVSETQRITTLFNDKLDFRRQLRAGDTVRVLRESQFIDGEATGNDRLLAVEFSGRNWTQTAYLHDDGNYYDDEGQSLARAFMRHPLPKEYRISSRYNPNRLHPVTGRVSPHNGTDYAAPTGTPILAAGDGVVTRVENHPIAGKYVVLEHGGQYRTRYLHMSRIDVKRGQTVSRGQRIGAVGATGRVTGAHLHYEFHINGRAVDSLNARIPMATSVPSSDRQAFLAQVYQYQSQMTELIAANRNTPQAPKLGATGE
ncbi:peptidoglycan DD-metalloendopeptidase family protein [Ferrimonas marina]|uniref:peptidoglycan DD-metalloendopeptidase family protein n=1 Tax=Ferrimonas marina TaxID=299255 RepID=UPI00082BDD74|nr:peptidoglycan DD-metalloendopeptidase family protein [Ferrimonas marina]